MNTVLDCYCRTKGVGKRIQRGKVMKVDVTHRGYATVVLSKDAKRSRREIHTLVSAAFLGKRPAKHHTHHKNHNKLDNRLSNLAFVQEGEHVRSHHQGEGCYKAKLTEKDVKEIRKRLAKGEYQKDIAADYGVSRSLVGQIKTRDTWKHI